MRVQSCTKIFTLAFFTLLPLTANAGELTFSGNWAAPATQQGYAMSEKKSH